MKTKTVRKKVNLAQAENHWLAGCKIFFVQGASETELLKLPEIRQCATLEGEFIALFDVAVVDLSKVKDLEFQDVHEWDAPDFVDAYVSSASIQDADGTWRDATEEELDVINEDTDFTHTKLTEV